MPRNYTPSAEPKPVAPPASLPIRGPTTTWRAGEVLIRQGSSARELWWIRSGSVLQCVIGPAGTMEYCGIRGPGALIGLDCLDQRTSHVDVRALTRVEADRIGRADVDRQMDDASALATELLRMTSAELERVRNERRLASGSATSRLARYLLDREEHPERWGEFDLPRQVLASVLDMRHETLSRSVTRLRDGGVLNGTGIRLRVVDIERLRQLLRSAEL